VSGIGRGRWWAVALLVAACGCGPGQATVSGRVTYKDKPVVYGAVTMVGPDEKAAFGTINPDGTYTVEGLTPGDVRIGITSRDPAKSRGPRKVPPSTGGNGWVPLPRGYESAANSGLACTVKSGSNTRDIDLK
jgi:hypothetical protein